MIVIIARERERGTIISYYLLLIKIYIYVISYLL